MAALGATRARGPIAADGWMPGVTGAAGWRIDATFAFRDGLIVRHEDRFDLWRWLRQALGAKGALLGWLPPVQRAVQAQAAKSLAEWRARQTSG